MESFSKKPRPLPIARPAFPALPPVCHNHAVRENGSSSFKNPLLQSFLFAYILDEVTLNYRKEIENGYN